MSALPRLLVVLPELAPESATHYAHYQPLLREVARLTTVTVIIETGTAAELPGMEVISQRRRHPLMRAAELARLLVAMRRRGYRAAYGSYSPYFGVVGGLVGRIVGMRTTYWHCRSDFFNAQVQAGWGARKLLLDTVPFLLSLHLSHALMTGTDGLADLYARRFRLPRGKVRVVPNDVDLDRWRPDGGSEATRAAKGGELDVLFVGRLSEHKGARELGAIFRRVAAAVPGVRLTIAGDGPERARVEVDLRDEIAARRVRILGAVPNSVARSLMWSSDLFLMPSRSEGFPRVLLEAMAAGIPFVAADVGGVSEVVADSARAGVVPPGDVDAFAACVVGLLRQPERRAELAHAGSEHVRRYDVRAVAPRFVAAVTAAGRTDANR